MINVNVSVKNIIYVKTNMFGILVHVFAKAENMESIMDDSVIACDDVIESPDEEIQTILTNFNKNIYNL